MKEVELQTMHDALYIQAFEQFDEIATMGKCFHSVLLVVFVLLSIFLWWLIPLKTKNE